MCTVLTLFFGTLVYAAVPATQAQPAWPAAKPVTLIVPLSAGGSVDFAARAVAAKLSERLKQSVVIENVAGAGGAIGVGKAAQAAPDGYTLVVAPDSPIVVGKLVNPAAFRFDPMADLAPVALLNTAPMVLVARPGLPIHTFADFVKLAKASPGKYSYATSGVGTTMQLATELLKKQYEIFVTHIPYRGGSQIATDVIGNQVDLAMLSGTSAISHIKANRITPLGVTDSKRLALLPDVPAFAEMPGSTKYVMSSWIGIFAPANTPAAIVERLNREINEVLKSEDVKARFAEQGALAASGTVGEFTLFVKNEYARNKEIIESAGIKE
jgi:tripartite-type tricarboxylate transporter receptor subunit TctC